jgi:probable rRNA maturation factor
MPKRLDLSINASRWDNHVPFLKKNLLAAHKLAPTPIAEFSIALVGNAKMSELHKRFMGIPGPTDVLTFELDADDNGHVTSGEVVICVPYARKIAKNMGHDLKLELLLYAIHGLLHLSGMNDLKPADYRAMHAMEDKILKKLGLGAVFDRKGTSDAR